MTDPKELPLVKVVLDHLGDRVWVQHDLSDPIDVQVIEYDGGTHQLENPRTTILPTEIEGDWTLVRRAKNV